MKTRAIFKITKTYDFQTFVIFQNLVPLQILDVLKGNDINSLCFLMIFFFFSSAENCHFLLWLSLLHNGASRGTHLAVPVLTLACPVWHGQASAQAQA